MPHAKLPRKSTHIDMTAMCDVAFLLLTFFMLATKFKPPEPVVVSTPKSISDITVPHGDIVLLLTVDAKGRIYVAMDDRPTRQSVIEMVNSDKDLKLTKEEMNTFVADASEGIPFSALKAYLDATPDQQKVDEVNAAGVPADTAVLAPNNELAEWIKAARTTNGKIRICIKADGAASYPSVQKIIKTLEGYKIFKFNLITDLKGIPVGTAAYDDAHKGDAKK
jgi:biopolymer transport protein ExbD